MSLGTKAFNSKHLQEYDMLNFTKWITEVPKSQHNIFRMYSIIYV